MSSTTTRLRASLSSAATAIRGNRLGQVGVQRLEFLDLVSRDDFEAFLEEVYIRMSGESVSSAGVRQG